MPVTVCEVGVCQTEAHTLEHMYTWNTCTRATCIMCMCVESRECINLDQESLGTNGRAAQHCYVAMRTEAYYDWYFGDNLTTIYRSKLYNKRNKY